MSAPRPIEALPTGPAEATVRACLFRWFLPFVLLAVGSCSDQARFRASASRVEVQGVSLAIESCEPSRPRCDFEFELTNESDRCVAFHNIRLPPESYIFFESTLPARIQAQPSERALYTWVVLRPGASFAGAVDVQALTGLRDLSAISTTVSTEFISCSSFVLTEQSVSQEEPVEPRELESGTITFSRIS